MRLWSFHPQYLDAKGLVALWREALLAKHVLEGRTKGYTHHPQLERFKATSDPIAAINHYLREVHHEARRRNYSFDDSKVNWEAPSLTISVTKGQMAYERMHLLRKLEIRDPEKFAALKNIQTFATHPMFCIIDGDVERWEIQQ